MESNIIQRKLKRSWFIIVAVFLFNFMFVSATQVSAQSNLKKRTYWASQPRIAKERDMDDKMRKRFGIKGGANYSSFSFAGIGGKTWRLGGHVGGFAFLPLSYTFALQPELLYTSKGAELRYQEPVYGFKRAKINFDYVELPLLMVYRGLEPLQIQAGPYAAYMFRRNFTGSSQDTTALDYAQPGIKNFNRIDYGVAGGLALDFPRFVSGLRYNYGLRKVATPNISSLVKGGHNNVFQLYLGYKF